MRRLIASLVLLMSLPPADGQSPPPVDANALVQKIQEEVKNPAAPPESKPDASIPRGEILGSSISETEFYPGTTTEFQVYVPAQYDPAKPACLLVKMDGLGGIVPAVLDTLIAKKEIPVIIAVGMIPGRVYRDPEGTPNRRVGRYNRDFQYDSMNDRYPEFVLNKILPAVEALKTQNGRAIHLSTNPDDRMTMGASSGGICAFNLAWRRPDQFHRVYSTIGTFVAMRGGNEYPALIRKTEPKPIRVFLEDGSQDAWNLNLGSWFEANTLIESALTFAGYDVAHAWGTHGHDGGPGEVVFPDVMRWMWRDYGTPIKAGNSQNDKLGETLAGNWELVGATGISGLTALATDPKGNLFISADFSSTPFPSDFLNRTIGFAGGRPTRGLAFGTDGKSYVCVPTQRKIIAFDGSAETAVATNVVAHSLLITHDGTIYASEPGEHTDMPSTIWRIKPDGTKQKMDEGLHDVSGIAFSPDHALFFAAERSSKWIYSYLVNPDGSFTAKQPFNWLHMSDIEGNPGTEDIAFDLHGNLYAATRMGVQVSDQSGRVRAIIPLPTPCGPVRSLCFGGPKFDVLYVTDGQRVWKRQMKVPGYQQWMAPVDYPSQGEG